MESIESLVIIASRLTAWRLFSSILSWTVYETFYYDLLRYRSKAGGTPISPHSIQVMLHLVSVRTARLSEVCGTAIRRPSTGVPQVGSRSNLRARALLSALSRPRMQFPL